MTAAIAAALACAVPAAAETTTYPAGGGTFDADAQGWTGSDAGCSMASGVSVVCDASTSYDAGAGMPGGALATYVDVTVNVLGLFAGSATWASPAFAIPAGASVTGAALSFDAALAPGGLMTLAPTSAVDVALADLTDAGTTPLTLVALDDRDSGFSSHQAVVPASAVEPGHSYRLVFTTDTTSSAASAGVLGRVSTLLDNVALDVTTADPTASGGKAGDGGVAPGAGTGAGTGTGAAAGGAAGAGGQPRARLSAAELWRLVRSLNLAAQVGPHAGGSLVPRRHCTIVGTPRADRLLGTPGVDVICGLGGHDVVYGRGGADLIDGGAGRDKIRGGGGRDVLLGLGGADRLRAGAGADVLAGGARPDLLSGGPGADRLRGGPGADRLLGGAGDDLARGGMRLDRLAGVERARR